MGATSRKATRKRTARKRTPPAIRLPKDVLLHWPAHLPFFSRVVEGGPGRPGTLAIWAAIFIGIGGQGIRLIERSGIDSVGPALVFLGAAGILFLLVWLLVKGLLRGRAVLFYLSERGVGIIPSPRQEKVDRWMGLLTWLSFLATFRGGQWSAWRPFTPWKSVRRVEIHDADREILLKGGPWDIRLACSADLYGTVKPQVLERVRAASRRCVFVGV